jgi:hypothetical protein
VSTVQWPRLELQAQAIRQPPAMPPRGMKRGMPTFVAMQAKKPRGEPEPNAEKPVEARSETRTSMVPSAPSADGSSTTGNSTRTPGTEEEEIGGGEEESEDENEGLDEEARGGDENWEIGDDQEDCEEEEVEEAVSLPPRLRGLHRGIAPPDTDDGRQNPT